MKCICMLLYIPFSLSSKQRNFHKPNFISLNIAQKDTKKFMKNTSDFSDINQTWIDTSTSTILCITNYQTVEVIHGPSSMSKDDNKGVFDW